MLWAAGSDANIVTLATASEGRALHVQNQRCRAIRRLMRDDFAAGFLRYGCNGPPLLCRVRNLSQPKFRRRAQRALQNVCCGGRLSAIYRTGVAERFDDGKY